jgi:uncharacterized protein YqgC (DUF456 family)
MNAVGILVTVVMFLSILIIPLGWPGLWIMVGLVGLGAVLGEVGPGVILATLAIAAAAELLEFVVVKRMSTRYGGSNAAFWGAILGGTVGVFMGLPIPLLGPVLAGVLGSFIGAAAVSFWQSRDVMAASRVGWGVVLARALAAFLKVAAAFIILVIGGAAWIIA